MHQLGSAFRANLTLLHYRYAATIPNQSVMAVLLPAADPVALAALCSASPSSSKSISPEGSLGRQGT